MGDRLKPVITWRSSLVEGSDCPTCKLVGLVLSLHMSERGTGAFPSNKTLAEECSLGVSTVREHLNTHLHKQGWLKLVERGGTAGGERRANEWQASTPSPARGGGSPTGNGRDPRHDSAQSPPASGSQVVPGTDHVTNGEPKLQCPNPVCDQTFPDIDSRDEHYENCVDPDFIPAESLPVSEASR